MALHESQVARTPGFMGVARKAFEWLKGEQESIPLIRGEAQYSNAKDFRSSPEGTSFLTAAYYIGEAAQNHGFRARRHVQVRKTEYGDTFEYPSIVYGIDLIPRHAKNGESPHRALKGIIDDIENSSNVHELVMEEVLLGPDPLGDQTGEHLLHAVEAIRTELAEGDI